MSSDSPRLARILVIAAAIAWSSSTIFIRLLQEPSRLNLHQPQLSALQIAFYRSLFAGLILLPLVRKTDIWLTRPMLLMVFAFGMMTALYLSALGEGPAANAILLQNTAPVWVYFLGVYVFSEAPDRRTLYAVLVAMCGAAIIVLGNWPRGQPDNASSTQVRTLVMAAASGIFYALVILMLRRLRHHATAWLTALNLLGGTTVILAFALASGELRDTNWLLQPTPPQLLFLALFGLVQLALPYVLFARGLRSISSQEAGLITLIEPLLNPLWAYLIAPNRDTPTYFTLLGGAILLLALLWRFSPRREVKPDQPR